MTLFTLNTFIDIFNIIIRLLNKLFHNMLIIDIKIDSSDNLFFILNNMLYF